MSMNERVRNVEDREQASAAGSAGGSGGTLAALRASAEQLAAAGRDAIDRALSQDSERFLESNRQRSAQ